MVKFSYQSSRTFRGIKMDPGDWAQLGEMSRDASGKAQSKQSHSGYMRVRDYDSNMVRWNLVWLIHGDNKAL